MMTENRLTAADLEQGDKLRDTDGHGKTNPWGPDLTDEITVKKRWRGDAWLLAPVAENGRISSESFALSFEKIDERLASGRYEPVDCEVNRELDAGALPIDASADVYIRFGDIPDGERSTNHTDNSKEEGVSAYQAVIESVPAGSDHPAMFVPVGNKIQQIILMMHRDTYLITGEEVGRGNDGEPVLQNIEIVCELAKESDQSGFVPANL